METHALCPGCPRGRGRIWDMNLASLSPRSPLLPPGLSFSVIPLSNMGNLEAQRGKAHLPKFTQPANGQSCDVDPGSPASEPCSYPLDVAASEDGRALVRLAPRVWGSCVAWRKREINSRSSPDRLVGLVGQGGVEQTKGRRRREGPGRGALEVAVSFKSGKGRITFPTEFGEGSFHPQMLLTTMFNP